MGGIDIVCSDCEAVWETGHQCSDAFRSLYHLMLTANDDYLGATDAHRAACQASRAVLANPDVVMRALGMEPQTIHIGEKSFDIWVGPRGKND